MPKLIPLEFQELPGFQQESVGDSKDLNLHEEVLPLEKMMVLCSKYMASRLNI
jgi:hypothetical protein